MITIRQLKAMPEGTSAGGYELVIKTAKKKWQEKDCWFQTALLTDETGDMLATVRLGKYNPLISKTTIHIIIGQIQTTIVSVNKQEIKEPLLFIDQFTVPSITAGEYEDEKSQYLEDKRIEDEVVVRSKVRCLIVCSILEGFLAKHPDRLIPKLSDKDKETILEYVDFVIEREMK
ncbi:MAG: hypothetical protein ACUZ9M_00700 [Candidatus Scalindua sp.]